MFQFSYNDESEAYYYFNTKTKARQWEHPLDAEYKKLVEKARKQYHLINGGGSGSVANDLSEDVSQIDSGIRSLQGDDSDLLTDISPTGAIITIATVTSASTPTTATTFANTILQSKKMEALIPSGGGRFLAPLEKRNGSSGTLLPLQPLQPFQPIESVRHKRFEITNYTTNNPMPSPLTGLALKTENKLEAIARNTETGTVPKKGFTLTGKGSLFLKSHVKKTANSEELDNGKKDEISIEPSREIVSKFSADRNVKSILRDSSLTDVRSRINDNRLIENDSEDRKSVRFSLEAPKVSNDMYRASSDVSSNENEDDDDEEDNEEDDWDFAGEGVETHVKEIKVTLNKNKIQGGTLVVERPEEMHDSLSRVRIHSPNKSTEVEKNNLTTLFDRKIESGARIKPLYEDTDSESIASVRGFGVKVINDSDFMLSKPSIEEARPMQASMSRGLLEQERDKQMVDLEKEMNAELDEFKLKIKQKQQAEEEKLRKKMLGELEKLQSELAERNRIVEFRAISAELQPIDKPQRGNGSKLETDVQNERAKYKTLFEEQRKLLEKEYENNSAKLTKELSEKLNDKKIELESQHNVEVEKFKQQLRDELDEKKIALVKEHRENENVLQQNHKVILEELERDLKTEEDLIRKDHTVNLTQLKEKMAHELDIERQRMRETGENLLYEKVRCEKRLLEDKYRCLKDKYARLKADVRISLERRHLRREQQSIATGSETERSNSNKQAGGNNDVNSSSISAPLKSIDFSKPPAMSIRRSRDHSRDRSQERDHANLVDAGGKKFGAAAKYLSHVQQQYQDDTTSISQSETTISNNFHRNSRRLQSYTALGDNGNSDSEAFGENNNNNNNNINVKDNHGRQRKKIFTRMKSASTSRLNSRAADTQTRPCTPIENLRRQLQKLEDLEDQFPDNSVDTTYHLRYPFTNSSNEPAGASSELEFFKHRIHLERDSVRRAKDSLRSQRTNFRARQRDIKHRHQHAARHSIDQMVQEEKELTEMEVNLHRTRALLGEKVIRLRHLEQSLQRVYNKDKTYLNQPLIDDKLTIKDDATISDLSSHSSSGFSSTDLASDTRMAGKRRDPHPESSEIIQSLENLNAEIREIWEILSKQRTHGNFGFFLNSLFSLKPTFLLFRINATTVDSLPRPPLVRLQSNVNSFKSAADTNSGRSLRNLSTISNQSYFDHKYRNQSANTSNRFHVKFRCQCNCISNSNGKLSNKFS